MPGKFLAEFELYIMLAVARLEEEDGEGGYGAAIWRVIEDRTGRPVAIGALYATLGRLADKGLLRFSVSAPQPVRGGRSKKSYRLTRKGREALSHSAEMMQRMLEGLAFAKGGGKR